MLGLNRRKRKSARSVPPRTPEAVDGRRHIDIQTDVYLEELTDTVPESDNGTQTDAFLDRPPTPLFVPQKTGLDAATQIANGELGHFASALCAEHATPARMGVAAARSHGRHERTHASAQRRLESAKSPPPRAASTACLTPRMHSLT